MAGIQIRCLIPDKIASGLVGSIQGVQSTCPNASITVLETSPQCPQSEERVIEVECNHSEIYAIFSQLIPRIYEELKSSGINNVREPEICALFSSTNMGSIIGKKGSVISNMRKTSGAFLKAHPNKLQNSDERVLYIRGPVDTITECLNLIYSTVELETGPYNKFKAEDGVNIPRDNGVGGYQDNAGSGYKLGAGNAGAAKNRGGRTLIRCLIPNKIAGGLIGKGGENIKGIRSACPNATIKILETPECPHAEERIYQVECDPSEIYAIFSQLLPQIAEGLIKNRISTTGDPEVCVLFSGVNMGSIIGRGGQTISKLRESSGAFLKAYPNKLQNSEERVLLIRGEVDKIIDCISQIYSKVQLEDTPYTLYNPADGANMPREAGVGGYQESYEGFDSGPQNPPQRRSQGGRDSHFGAPPPFREPSGDFYQQPNSYNHGPQTFHQPPYAPPQQHQHEGAESEESGGLLSKFIMKYPFTSYPGADGDANAVKEVTLENSLTGCVIGDKGVRIRDVRSSSGARIRIGEFDSAGPGERLITIEGTNVQAHLAEYMLQCCVQSFSAPPQQEVPKSVAPPRKKLRPNPAQAPSSQIDQAYPWDSSAQVVAPDW